MAVARERELFLSELWQADAIQGLLEEMAAQAHAGAEQGVHQGGHPGTARAPPAFRSLGAAEEEAAGAAVFRALGADEPTMATMATMISDEEIARALQVEMEQEGYPYPYPYP